MDGDLWRRSKPFFKLVARGTADQKLLLSTAAWNAPLTAAGAVVISMLIGQAFISSLQKVSPVV